MTIHGFLDRAWSDLRTGERESIRRIIREEISSALRGLDRGILGSFNHSELATDEKPVSRVLWGLQIETYPDGKSYVRCFPQSASARPERKPKKKGHRPKGRKKAKVEL